MNRSLISNWKGKKLC